MCVPPSGFIEKCVTFARSYIDRQIGICMIVVVIISLALIVAAWEKLKIEILVSTWPLVL